MVSLTLSYTHTYSLHFTPWNPLSLHHSALMGKTCAGKVIGSRNSLMLSKSRSCRHLNDQSHESLGVTAVYLHIRRHICMCVSGLPSD